MRRPRFGFYRLSNCIGFDVTWLSGFPGDGLSIHVCLVCFVFTLTFPKKVKTV